MKRILSSILSVVMVSFLVASVFPAVATSSSPFSVNGNEYATLAAAIAAANDGDTVQLNADYSTDSEVNLSVNKNLKISSAEGGHFKITVSKSAVASERWMVASANLSIENVNLDIQQGIEMTAGLFTLKNSHVNMNISSTTVNTTSDAHTFLTLKGDASALLSNATVEHSKSKNGTVIYMENGTLSLMDGTTVTACGTGSTANSATFSVVAIKCGSYDKNNAHQLATVNVGSDCAIRNNMGNNQQYRPFSCLTVVHSHKDGTTTLSGCLGYAKLNLAKGSKLELNGGIVCTVSNLKTSWIFNNTGFEIDDFGCTYTVVSNYEASSASFHTMWFPVINNADDGKMFYTADGSVSVSAGESLKLTKGQLYSFTYRSLNQPLVTNTVGASIRTDDPHGIRFQGNVNLDEYAALIADENVEWIKFGIAITPDEVTIDETYLSNAVLGEDYICAEYTVDELDSDGSYVLALYFTDDQQLENSGKELLETKLYACAYYVIKYEDAESEQIICADFDSEENGRSVFDVAKGYYELGYTDVAFVNRILDVCDYFA